MTADRLGGVPKGTIVDRGGYIGLSGRSNIELVRPAKPVPDPLVSPVHTIEAPPAVLPQMSGDKNSQQTNS